MTTTSNVLKLVFEDQKTGFYVDVGAHDGEYPGNLTRSFFKHGWGGICIEPDKRTLNKGKRRRVERTTWIHGAVVGADHPDVTAEYFWEGLVQHSGLEVDEEAVKKVYVHMGRKWQGFRQRVVPAIRLNSILKKQGVERLDLVVISTNGTERKAISSLDVGRWQPHIIAAAQCEAYNSSMILYMKAMGYYLLWKDLSDDGWLVFSNNSGDFAPIQHLKQSLEE